MKKVNKRNGVISNTWLPCFPGFYESIIDAEFENEIDFFNERRSENGISGEIEWTDIDFDYDKYRRLVSIEWTNKVESKLIELGLIKSIKFDKVVSPREYNFVTDSINCEINYYPAKLMKFIKANRESIEKYIHDKHTSRDGFISFESNSLDEWIEETNGFKNPDNSGHRIGSILEACLLTQYEGWSDAVVDIYEGLSDFYSMTSECIENFDLLCDGIRCPHCNKLYLGSETKAHDEYKRTVEKQTEIYVELMGFEPSKVKTFSEVYPEVCCDECKE